MKLSRWSAFSAFALVIGVALFLGYSWYENRDPQGEATSNCYSMKLKPVPNKSDMVATAHNTVCDGFGGNSVVYVYIHGVDQDDSRKSLVFRYSDKYDVPSPTIEWINDSSLRISVGEVSQVTKQLFSIDGVTVTYNIGKQDYSPEIK